MLFSFLWIAIAAPSLFNGPDLRKEQRLGELLVESVNATVRKNSCPQSVGGWPGLASLQTAWHSPDGACKYYAYIVYGDANLVSNIKKSERIYREVTVFRSQEGFKACCNDYCSYTCAGFAIKNIGPYDNEAVAYMELQRHVARLEAEGYRPYERFRHLIIGILQFGYVPCN